MRIRRQWKVLTRIVAALATAVTVGYGYTAHHAVIEYWHIMRLHAYRPEVRKEAAGVLGELKALRAVPYLVGVLESDEDKAVREEAMLALGEICTDFREVGAETGRKSASPGGAHEETTWRVKRMHRTLFLRVIGL